MAGEQIRLYYKTSLKLAGSSTLYLSILGYSATVRRVFTSVIIQLQVLTWYDGREFPLLLQNANKYRQTHYIPDHNDCKLYIT